jgi:hypothetical protein
MAFIQRIQSPGDRRCGDTHGECAVIDCITTEAVRREDGTVIHEAGVVVWHSHMNAAIHPEHRLNPDHPAEDHRGSRPVQVTATAVCGDCKAHPAAQGSVGL